MTMAMRMTMLRGVLRGMLRVMLIKPRGMLVQSLQRRRERKKAVSSKKSYKIEGCKTFKEEGKEGVYHC